jgi:hypothetical protein
VSAVRAIVVLAISAFFLFVAGPPMFEKPPWPYTGVHAAFVPPFERTVTVRVDRDSPGYRAGLRTGDVVGCLSLATYETLFPFYSTVIAYSARPVRVCVRRDGGVWRSVTFAPQRMPPSAMFYHSALLGALRLIVYAVFLFVGCALVLVRPGLMTWCLFGYCLASAPTAASMGMWLTLPPALYAAITLPTSGWVGLGAPILALFALTVPSDSPPSGWRRTLFVVVAVAFALGALEMAVFPAAVLDIGSVPRVLDEAFTFLTVAIVVARLVTMQREERARFGWAAFAIIFGVLVNDVRNVVSSGTISMLAGYATVVMPLALMYAILRRHVIDVRFVLSRTLVFGVITTIVVGFIGVVDWATNLYLHQARAAMAIDALVTIGLGFVLHRTYRWVEFAVDSLIFREKHLGEEYLHRLARTLPFAESEETIDRAIVCAPYEKLALTGAALFRVDRAGFAAVCAEGWPTSALAPLPHDHALPRFFMAERAPMRVDDLHSEMRAALPESAGPALAVPIFQRNELTGFALYGLHRDGTKLDPDEERTLERLCESAAQAYTGVELDAYRGVRTSPLAIEVSPS